MTENYEAVSTVDISTQSLGTKILVYSERREKTTGDPDEIIVDVPGKGKIKLKAAGWAQFEIVYIRVPLEKGYPWVVSKKRSGDVMINMGQITEIKKEKESRI